MLILRIVKFVLLQYNNVMTNDGVQKNISLALEKIRQAKLRAARAEKVRLLAVSKFHSASEIESAYQAGQRFFGENRVQEACEKFIPLKEKFPDINLHMIGSLQTNKVKNIVQIASCIESVDRISLIAEIEKQCAKIAPEKQIEIYLELHTAEDSKAGFLSVSEMQNALEFCAVGNAPHVVPKGFMTMAPFSKNESDIRNSFRTLKRAQEKLQKDFPCFDLSELSMGMSGDFEIAIEEGSTQVRIGTMIFGERQ